MNKFAISLMASAALMLCAAPAFAGNDKPTSTPAPQADASAAALGVGVGVGIGQGGDASATGGRADASASLGNLNSFGGAATAINGPNTNLNTSGSLSGAYAGGSTSGATAAGGAGGAGGSSSATAGPSSATGGASGGNVLSNVTNYKRSAASASTAIGQINQADGMCRDLYGIGGQWMGGGFNVSLPGFKDKLCAELATDKADEANATVAQTRDIEMARILADLAGNESAVQYLSAKYATVNAAVTQARTAK